MPKDGNAVSDLHQNGVVLLIEPTSACNLDCSYCYKGNSKPSIFMAPEIAKRAIRQISDYNENHGTFTQVVWHGGEPTLMGASFFKEAFDYSKSIRTRFPIRHTVQTNGTLLSDEILDLFAENHVSISVSLDGPPEYHDLYRKKQNGSGSYASIYKALRRAKEKNVEIGILMSVGKSNACYVRPMFEFCRECGFTFGLNPITRDLYSVHEDTEVLPETYLEACLTAFDLWFYQDSPTIQSNPGYGVTRLLLTKSRLSDCFLCENCQHHFLSIGPEGDVYPCNRFYGFKQYCFGNILKDELISILNSQIRACLLTRSASTIAACQECEIRELCNGGCMHHAIAHSGSFSSPDHLCLVYRGLIEHATLRLTEIISAERNIIYSQKGT